MCRPPVFHIVTHKLSLDTLSQAVSEITNIMKTVCDIVILLILIGYANLASWAAYAIDINMILHTIFLMFVYFRNCLEEHLEGLHVM